MALPGNYLVIPRRIVDMPVFMAMNNNRWTEAYTIMTHEDFDQHEVHPPPPFPSPTLAGEGREWITGHWATVRPYGLAQVRDGRPFV